MRYICNLYIFEFRNPLQSRTHLRTLKAIGSVAKEKQAILENLFLTIIYLFNDYNIIDSNFASLILPHFFSILVLFSLHLGRHILNETGVHLNLKIHVYIVWWPKRATSSLFRLQHYYILFPSPQDDNEIYLFFCDTLQMKFFIVI